MKMVMMMMTMKEKLISFTNLTTCGSLLLRHITAHKYE